MSLLMAAFGGGRRVGWGRGWRVHGAELRAKRRNVILEGYGHDAYAIALPVGMLQFLFVGVLKKTHCPGLMLLRLIPPQSPQKDAEVPIAQAVAEKEDVGITNG